nr:hypothetical protein Iba_chr13bCG8460 [Ipomoea batatas]
MSTTKLEHTLGNRLALRARERHIREMIVMARAVTSSQPSPSPSSCGGTSPSGTSAVRGRVRRGRSGRRRLWRTRVLSVSGRSRIIRNVSQYAILITSASRRNIGVFLELAEQRGEERNLVPSPPLYLASSPSTTPQLSPTTSAAGRGEKQRFKAKRRLLLRRWKTTTIAIA